ncbi:RNA polymerase I-specific transcription initiation factor RRN7 [Nakaseomyces bracarensis]|uniref:RNA polymerase I-specific transcription initiation factor RRN7 n=1 Tax=Nakaseomyces bracarensis TaxID=273131 RepID=A0ABR4NQG4_9SACH
MSTFIRGPVCGTDNCPSRLWRIIDGRRTCRFGHVMDGDIEFNNDDDDMGGGAMSSQVVTRRLNLTTNAVGGFQASMGPSQMSQLDKIRQQKESKKRLFGPEANTLFVRTIQFILRRQTKILINEMHFPSEFESLVKLIWTRFLHTLDYESQEEVNIADDEILDRSTQNNATQNNPGNGVRKLGIHMVATVSILYLASFFLGLPVFTNDYIRWICNQEIPYFHCSRIIPSKFASKLPNYYFTILDGGRPPSKGLLNAKIAAIATQVKFSEIYSGPLFVDGFLLKTTLLLTLPPVMYFKTSLIISNIDAQKKEFHLKEDMSIMLNKRHFHLVPEYRLLGYMIITVRNELLSNSEEYSENYMKALIEQPYRDIERSKETKEQNIVDVSFGRTGIENIIDWNKKDTSDFLNFIEQKLLGGNSESSDTKRLAELSIDQRIAKRQLYKLFPMNEKQSTNPDEFQTYANELQEKYLKQSLVSASYSESNNHDRKKLVSLFEEKMLTILSEEFAIKKSQLSYVVRKVEQHLKKFVK